jgi:hypothetical protein
MKTIIAIAVALTLGGCEYLAPGADWSGAWNFINYSQGFVAPTPMGCTGRSFDGTYFCPPGYGYNRYRW